MRHHATLLLATLLALPAAAQRDEFFEPYKATTLRLPSVPLVTHDPYISFWSPYDHLNDGTTRHWDGQVKAMDGLLRVDGVPYRFMGKRRDVSLQAIAPMGNQGAWQAKVRFAKPADGWERPGFPDKAWATQRGPFGSKGEYPYIQTSWTGDNKDIYIRRHVELTEEDIRGDLYVVYSHDDNFELYVNGVRVAALKDKWEQNVRLRLTGEARDSLRAGDNVLAFHVHNTTGGAQADLGLYRNARGLHNGYATLLPMADEGPWEARATTASPGALWAAAAFDDSAWPVRQGAFGSAGEYPNVRTDWTAAGSDIYIRRRFTLSAADLGRALHLIYSHDDVCEAYLNGTRVLSTGNTWLQNVDYALTPADMALLAEGENVLAYHVHNTTGGALADIGLYADDSGERQAGQKSCSVLATNTYYTFECGPAELDVVFTVPFLMDDPDLMSTPVNYISYRVRSTDGAPHEAQLYFATSPELAVDNNMQPTVSTLVEEDGVRCVKSGSREQKVLGRSGDHVTIDWGYLYLPEVNGSVTVAHPDSAALSFASRGALPAAATPWASSEDADMPALAYVHDFGAVTSAASYMMLAYDEVRDIQYMDVDYKGWWAREGKTVTRAIAEMRDAYDDVMERCRRQDKVIYDDGLAAGNQKYAELLSASYRQCVGAHKMFRDNRGNLLFFSKENDSNGCVNTVDLTYPSAPLFLLYNTALLKGMCTSILDYCESDRWGFPFAAHDLGTYPKANNQVYSIRFPDSGGGFSGNMPIEESGNIVILAAAISLVDGNARWAGTHWETLTRWADYLAQNGLDPENQLCTDDFAGHLAHNTNLSLKAIMGVAGYSLMCKLRGEAERSEEYMARAREMAGEWVARAKEGTHYRLAFDRPGTWSLKYNMVWDKAWDTGLFPEAVRVQEFASYSSHTNAYGVPLDNRAEYSKTDWLAWAAALGRTKAQFTRMGDFLWKYVHETKSRVPLSDWFWTTSGDMRGFRARSVVGGHWMKVFCDKMLDGSITALPSVGEAGAEGGRGPRGWYNLAGQRVERPSAPGVYIRDGRKTVVR